MLTLLRLSRIPVIALLITFFVLPSFAQWELPATSWPDGQTDLSSCLTQLFNFAKRDEHTKRDLLPGISQPLIIPERMAVLGSGRGDAGYVGIILRVSPQFPVGPPLVVSGGLTGGPFFAVQIQGMTLDYNGRASEGLRNTQAEEQSFGRHLQITDCRDIGIDTESSGAQNSGPFNDLEIYPNRAGLATTRCMRVKNVISLRGVSNAIRYSTRPNIALAVDGGSSYSKIHVEHFATSVYPGSTSNTNDGIAFMDGQVGPNVDVGPAIGNRAGGQNISIFGVRCCSCSKIVADSITGRSISTNSVGFYLLGDGGGGGNTVINSAAGSHIYSSVTQGPTAVGPENSQFWNSTLGVWDATGSASPRVVVQACAAQGSINLTEWRNSWGQPVATVTANGTSQSSMVQLLSSLDNICTASENGTLMLEDSDPAGGHVLACLRGSNGSYKAVRIY
jgi:hypothetical protein